MSTNASTNVVRIAFYGDSEFLKSTENIKMNDAELVEYLSVILDGQLPDSVQRVALFSRDRPFRRVVIDLQ